MKRTGVITNFGTIYSLTIFFFRFIPSEIDDNLLDLLDLSRVVFPRSMNNVPPALSELHYISDVPGVLESSVSPQCVNVCLPWPSAPSSPM